MGGAAVMPDAGIVGELTGIGRGAWRDAGGAALPLSALHQQHLQTLFSLCATKVAFPDWYNFDAPDDDESDAGQKKAKRGGTGDNRKAPPAPSQALKRLQQLRVARHQHANSAPAAGAPGTVVPPPAMRRRPPAPPALPTLRSRRALAQVCRAVLATAFADRMAGTTATSCAVHPGWLAGSPPALFVPSSFPSSDAAVDRRVSGAVAWLRALITPLFWLCRAVLRLWSAMHGWAQLLWCKTPAEAAEAVAHACVARRGLAAGAYYADGKDVSDHRSPWAMDVKEARALLDAVLLWGRQAMAPTATP